LLPTNVDRAEMLCFWTYPSVDCQPIPLLYLSLLRVKINCAILCLDECLMGSAHLLSVGHGASGYITECVTYGYSATPAYGYLPGRRALPLLLGQCFLLAVSAQLVFKLSVVTFEEEPSPQTKPLIPMELVGKTDFPLRSFKGPLLSLTQQPRRLWRLRSSAPSNDRRKCPELCPSPKGVVRDCAGRPPVLARNNDSSALCPAKLVSD